MINAILVTAAALALGALLTWGGWRRSRALAGYFGVVIVVNLAQLCVPASTNALAFVIADLVATTLRFLVVLEVLAQVFAPFSGARRVAGRMTLLGLFATAGLLFWAFAQPAEPRLIFRGLAVASGCAGLLLLNLRVLTLYYYLPVHPVFKLTTSWFGAYLVLRAMLLGVATESTSALWVHAVGLSSAASVAWTLGIAWATWSGRHWSAPPHVPR